MECNICLGERVRSPVVTCCGHLFCWPCIYSWLLIQQQQQQQQKYNSARQVAEGSCPVCKGALSLVAGSNDFIPIYSSTSQDAPDQDVQNTQLGLTLPPRPTAARRQAGTAAMQPQHRRGQEHEYNIHAEMNDQLHAGVEADYHHADYVEADYHPQGDYYVEADYHPADYVEADYHPQGDYYVEPDYHPADYVEADYHPADFDEADYHPQGDYYVEADYHPADYAEGYNYI